MRSIKFRGLQAELGWVYGVPLFSKDDKEIAYLISDDCEYVVQAETVEQFTGLKDCKGVEIWEGDVLRQKPKSGSKFKVFWNKEDAAYQIEEIDELKLIHPLWRWAKVTQVIGNIYSNPELLKEPNEKV